MLHTLPSSTQKLSEAIKKDVVAVEASVPAASPHQTTLAPLTGRNRMKAKGEL